MKNYHILGRFWVGIGIGSMIGTVITLIISFAHGKGEYLPVMPQLEAYFPNEVSAVLVQFLLFCLIGTVFAEAGIIFMLDRWSFAAKCVIHFLITSVFFVPFLWLCYFQQTALWRLLIIPLNLAFTYVITWMISYFAARADVESINRKLRERRGETDGSHSNGGAV
ncbi:MAG: DUF3021 domain-containing protein [Clostridia bacterium]|nr:DUF3021 domain-containing protein [Clostridia bacterium]